MLPAQQTLAIALDGVQFEAPMFPVWSNTTAKPHEPGFIGDLLSRQMVEPVLFSDSILDMAASGIDTFIHVGPGDVTAGLVRRTVDGVSTHVVSTIEDIPATLHAVGTMGRS
jgi:[acyl-carrier-protein] S-malonyltransferase